MGKPLKDETGKRYGRWTVLQRVGDTDKARWLCLCDCGVTKSVVGTTLRNGDSTSCGCFARELKSLTQRLPEGVAAFNRLYARYEIGARRRGFSFSLTIEQFHALISAPCFYCGQPPTQHYQNASNPRVAKPWDTLKYTGVDRVDNSLGYDKDNSVSCCGDCNFMKGTLSGEAFVEKCRKVAFHNG